MGSKPLKQNFGAVVGNKVAKTPADVKNEQHEQLAAKTKLAAEHEKAARLYVERINNQLTDVIKQNTALHEEVANLKKDLEAACGAKKTLEDVIEKKDLELRNPPATAKKLPKKKVGKPVTTQPLKVEDEKQEDEDSGAETDA